LNAHLSQFYQGIGPSSELSRKQLKSLIGILISRIKSREYQKNKKYVSVYLQIYWGGDSMDQASYSKGLADLAGMDECISRGQQGHKGSKYLLKTEITVVMPANFSMNSR
jgi:hypothetical protein